MEDLKVVVGIVATVIGVLIGLAKLSHHERSMVWDWSKRLLLLTMYAGFVLFSAYGFWTFYNKTTAISRGEVILLFGHFFNLLAYCCFFIADLAKWLRAAETARAGEGTEKEEATSGQ